VYFFLFLFLILLSPFLLFFFLFYTRERIVIVVPSATGQKQVFFFFGLLPPIGPPLPSSYQGRRAVLRPGFREEDGRILLSSFFPLFPQTGPLLFKGVDGSAQVPQTVEGDTDWRFLPFSL